MRDLIRNSEAKFLMKADKSSIFEVVYDNNTFIAAYKNGAIVTFFQKGWVKQNEEGNFVKKTKLKAKFRRKRNQAKTWHEKANPKKAKGPWVSPRAFSSYDDLTD